MEGAQNFRETFTTQRKFISILSHQSLSLNHKFCQYELEQALKYDSAHNAILPIYLDEQAKSYFEEKLNEYDYIDISSGETSHNGFLDSKDILQRHGSIRRERCLRILGDDIVNPILVRLQGWGNIETYAENFRYGRGCKKDEEEADKLANFDSILFSI